MLQPVECKVLVKFSRGQLRNSVLSPDPRVPQPHSQRILLGTHVTLCLAWGDEICYVVKTAIAIERAANNNVLVVEISADWLFINTQGRLMTYPFRLRQGMSKSM